MYLLHSSTTSSNYLYYYYYTTAFSTYQVQLPLFEFSWLSFALLCSCYHLQFEGECQLSSAVAKFMKFAKVIMGH